MNKNTRRVMAVALGLIGWTAACEAAAVVGQPAPEFSLVDTKGRPQSLAALRGRYVVLEWFNKDCPFVRKHYGSGNMQRLQTVYGARGVVWLTVVSSAPGHQGFITAEEGDAVLAERSAQPAALLLDPDGQLGQLYGAKTTPHLFIIDPEGVLVYAGAIDDTPSTDVADVPRATNYVAKALDEALAGKPVSVPQTKSYGCSVKY